MLALKYKFKREKQNNVGHIFLVRCLVIRIFLVFPSWTSCLLLIIEAECLDGLISQGEIMAPSHTYLKGIWWEIIRLFKEPLKNHYINTEFYCDCGEVCPPKPIREGRVLDVMVSIAHAVFQIDEVQETLILFSI